MASQQTGLEDNFDYYQSNVLFSTKHALPPLDLSFKCLLNSEGRHQICHKSICMHKYIFL